MGEGAKARGQGRARASTHGTAKVHHRAMGLCLAWAGWVSRFAVHSAAASFSLDNMEPTASGGPGSRSKPPISFPTVCAQ